MSNQGIAGLLEVEPFTGDTFETVAFRTCDLCEQTVVKDTWEGRPWRTFYRDPAEHLNVCENCVEDYLTEKP